MKQVKFPKLEFAKNEDFFLMLFFEVSKLAAKLIFGEFLDRNIEKGLGCRGL